MNSLAVVMEEPEKLSLSRLELQAPGDEDIVVDVEWSGISTGTERLLWTGRMPTFPGMGYPLVPGYESVGRVTHAGRNAGLEIGERVFVPGARCYGEVRGLKAHERFLTKPFTASVLLSAIAEIRAREVET